MNKTLLVALAALVGFVTPAAASRWPTEPPARYDYEPRMRVAVIETSQAGVVESCLKMLAVFSFDGRVQGCGGVKNGICYLILPKNDGSQWWQELH